MTTLVHPDSLWAATARPETDCPALAGETRADVCVVGCGFAGLSATLHLAEAGADVVALDAGPVGYGASGRNGGQVIPGLKLDPDAIERHFGPEWGPRVVAMAGGAPDLVFDLIRRHGIDCDARQGCWIQAVHGTAILPAVENRIRQWQARGVDARLLDRDETARLLGTGRYVAGLLDKRGGRLNPLGYARGLAAAAIANGARIHGHSAAVRIEPGTAGGWRVETAAGTVAAEQVILAVNGYVDALWPGLARTVIPVYSFQAATRPLSDNVRAGILPEGHVSSDTRRLLNYFRLEADGRFVIGGRGRFVDSGDPALYAGIKAAAPRLFPQLEGAEWEFHWGGRVALTLDHVPHLHALSPGAFAGLGFNGRGVAMATAMGRELAGRALGWAADELSYPLSEPRGVPFHMLRRPAIAVIGKWLAFRDRRESAA